VIRSIVAEFQEHQRRTRAFSRNARLMLVALGFLGVGQGAFTTLFTLSIVELGYSEDVLGLLIGLATLGGVATAVPAGLLCDRIGARRGLLIGTVVTALGVFIECTVTAAWLLLAGGLIAASGVTLLTVAQAPDLATSSAEEERAHLFSVAAALLVTVSIAGSLFAGSFPVVLKTLWPAMPLATAYRATLLVAGVVSAACCLSPCCATRRGSQPLPEAVQRSWSARAAPPCGGSWGLASCWHWAVGWSFHPSTSTLPASSGSVPARLA